MTAMTDLSTGRTKIDWPLVRTVSRSFYLTLRLLPRPVRSGITLAYLLARASDTIADASCAEASARLQALKILLKFARGLEDDLDPSTARFLTLSQGQSLAEQRLLAQLPELMKKLTSHPDRREIQAVWSLILEGQIFDLSHSFSSPLTHEQLDRYTFLVAGCVGRFWTQLCCKKIPQFAFLPRQEMEELGVRYGKGLQIINILRDRKEDTMRGRVYVRREDVNGYGEEALKAMQSGVEYAVRSPHPMLRYATLLPALIGIRTLRLIQPDSGSVKIDRAEVRRILIAALPSLWKPSFAQRLARRYGV